MKKITLLFLAALATIGSAKAQIAFGAELGLNISDLTETSGSGYNGSTYTYDPKAGVKVGGIAEVPLNRNFYLQPGVFFTTKGATYDGYYGNSTIDINYIQMPVNVLYKFGRPSGNRFFLGAGLAFAAVVGGHTNYNGHTYKIVVGNDYQNDDVRPLDFSFEGQLGYQLSSGLIFRLQSEAGIANILPGGDSNNGMYNYTTTISVAYLFGVQHHHIDKRKKQGARIN